MPHRRPVGAGRRRAAGPGLTPPIIRHQLYFSRWQQRRKPIPCRATGKRSNDRQIQEIRAGVDGQRRLAEFATTEIVRGNEMGTREYHSVLPDGVGEAWQQRWPDRNWLMRMTRAVESCLSERQPEPDDEETFETPYERRQLEIVAALFMLPADQVRAAARIADGFAGTAAEFLSTWESIRS